MTYPLVWLRKNGDEAVVNALSPMVRLSQRKLFVAVGGGRYAEVTGLKTTGPIMGADDLLNAIRPSKLSVGQFVSSTPLFGAGQDLARDAARRALTIYGAQFVQDLPRDDRLFKECAFRAGARHVAVETEDAGATPTEVLSSITEALSVESELASSLLLSGVNPSVSQACRLLVRSPSAEISRAAIMYYAGEDIPAGEDRDRVVALRARTAAQYPMLAGYFAAVPQIAEAIDRSEPLFKSVADASGQSLTKPIMTRMATADDPFCRVAVALGMLDGFPINLLPVGKANWEAAILLFRSALTLSDLSGQPVREIWNPTRAAEANGDWVRLARSVVNKGADARLPHDAGLPADLSKQFRQATKSGPFAAEVDLSSAADALLDHGLKSVGLLGHPDISRGKLKSWLIQANYRDVREENVTGVMTTAFDAALQFAQRVVIPAVLMHERLPGLPITRDLLNTAAAAAFNCLTEGATLTQMAALSQEYKSKAPILTARIVSEREGSTAAEGETALTTAPLTGENRVDIEWRRRFGIELEDAEWPVMTPIIEIMPGILFVPIETRAQAWEEGSDWNPHTPKLDRMGVKENHNCMGPLKSAGIFLDQGSSQPFSIRRVVGNSYERIASGVFRLTYDKEKGVANFPTPANYEFNGYNNVAAPKIAVEALEMIQALVSEKPQIVNPAVVSAAAMKKDSKRATPNPDLTIVRLLGYDPFPIYKVKSVIRRWTDAGLINSKIADNELSDFVQQPIFAPVRQSARNIVNLLTARLPDPEPAPAVARIVDVPASSLPKTSGLSGVFF